MKTYQQLLFEIGVDPFKIVGAPAWTESLSTMLFDLQGGGLKNVMIPLSPAIMKRVWPKPVRTTVFHLTDYTGLGKLKKMQGGKKSISAFFNMDAMVIQTGIKSEGGYIIEMDADILIASQDDLSSQPDKTGRRWVTFQSLVNPPTDPMPGLGGGAKLRGMEKDIEKMLWKIIKTHSDYPDQTPSEVEIAWTELGDEMRIMYKKTMGLIIKDYLDGMEVIMKKNSRVLGNLLTAYTKKRIAEPDPDSGDKPMWDELVVNNFKIKKVHISPEFGPDFEDDDDID
ncbi:uncharacterized protein METZ01_LOCUS260095, partial [marine metagenome]